MACRTARPKRELVRIVRAPGGAVSIDPTGRAAGRGAYLCRDGACWTAAGRKHAIEHALGVPLPGDVALILAAGPEPATPDMPNPARQDRAPTPSIPDTMIQGVARGQE